MKIYADGHEYRVVFSKVLSLLFLGLALIGLLLSIFGPEMLRLTTSAPYWPAANTLTVLAGGIVSAGTTQVTASGISIQRKTHLFAVGSWIAAMLNFISNWVLIPRIGALGAGIATFISYWFLSSLYLYWTQRLHPILLEKVTAFLFGPPCFSPCYPNGRARSREILLLKVAFSSLAILWVAATFPHQIKTWERIGLKQYKW